MGNCVGRQRRERPTAPGHPRKRAGRNEPLKKERLKWKSDYPMTDGQLRSKRDEFWDTAPAFEGRKEIWDALKAAAYAAEANDHELAQAILDGASITLPHGTLCECYDELGNRYQLPIYCLSPPVNLLLEHTEEESLEPPEPTPGVRREFPLKVPATRAGLEAPGAQICHLVLLAVLTPVFCSGSEAAAVPFPCPHSLTLPWAQCPSPGGEGMALEPQGQGA
ncbi:ubiquitin domain-containing protein 1 isoform X3 [Suricata suricatta]|uniref:ubiquitin domain-containing protein 1 isoform X3 n=1 Tax=Suricata suricatta TaxID=37032 RepID=UPI001155B1E4|nr:ubiquitin domain-containing protein 1 isoform X3 [Suricata suricatta]XP_029787121.1 ubiquitin domain-containing protein 1 isoform X3 [Suricata suricatta]